MDATAVVGLAPLVLVALATVVDARTGRGYGLGILSLLLLVCTSLVAAFFILSVQQFQQNPPVMHGLGAAMLFGAIVFIAFLVAAYCTLSLLVGAVVLAGVVGQWRWLAALVVAALVPVLVISLPILYANMTQSPVTQRPSLLDAAFQPVAPALFVVAQVTVLVYSIVRIVRPARPAPAR